MYRFIAVLATVALAAGGTSAFAKDGGDNSTVIDAELFGSQITGPVLSGVKPGGAPWDISRGDAKVRRDGRVQIRIEGLVIPPGGTNPLSNLSATVYCNNVPAGTTSAVKFSADGDARIDETLAKPLPSPCLQPTVFINPAPNQVINAGVYIAASGA
jgi:hypothetical protein